MFILGRCPRSLAVVTPARYEKDSMNLKHTFAEAEISLKNKSTNAAQVPPTLCLQYVKW